MNMLDIFSKTKTITYTPPICPKVVFLDLDNTVAENIVVNNIDYYKGMYINKRPIKAVINAIRVCYKSPYTKFVVISKTQGGVKGRREKVKWAKKYLRDFKPKFIFLYDNEPSTNKGKYIMKYCEENNIHRGTVLLIDDNKEVLIEADKLGIPVKYPQNVLVRADYLHNIK